MDDRIRNALDQVHAGEDLKARTLRQMLSRGRPARRALPAALALCALLLAAGLFGGWLYLAPVSSINIDINPSLELQVNRYGRVVGVEGLNTDGQTLAQRLPLRGLDYTSAVEQVIADQWIQELIREGLDVSITVTCGDEARSRIMLQDLERCTSHEPSVHCHSGSSGGCQHRQGSCRHSQGASAVPTPRPSDTSAPAPSAESAGGRGEHSQKRQCTHKHGGNS